MSRFAVGIDLGTTNCALSYVDLKASRRRPVVKTFDVPQLMGWDESGAEPLLPSFVYLLAEHESSGITAELPWRTPTNLLVGSLARRQGALVPGRLVSSAKSWLCHGGVDRTADILPWDADESLARISPVSASSLYLEHLLQAWNHFVAKGADELALQRQVVVMTVPASFDEVARELTVEAAHKAGFEKLILLEEPLAAFYHWLEQMRPDEKPSSSTSMPPGSTCVVVDCGGGTTDFSLIAVTEREGKARYERLAVGEHLLLGGDNMDMALARHVELILSPNRRLDSAQWGNLVASCRRVKEEMLKPSPPDSLTVNLAARGRKVVGGSRRCDLERETVHRLTLEGFFPVVGFEEEPVRSAQTGLQEFGLPYVADPAVTRHLAQFLNVHSETIREHSETDSHQPAAVLFNGGVFNAHACRKQVLDVMRHWFGDDWRPTVLETSSLDLAVSRGAAHYAWLRATGGERIKSGAARSYYVQVEAKDGESSEKSTVLCLVPHGLQEGDQITIEEPELQLQLGQPVSFPLFSSTVRTHDQAGAVIEIEPDQLHELPALSTVLRGGRRAGSAKVPVSLQAMLTEIGTLELYCLAKHGGNRWKLQLQVRQSPTGADVAQRTRDDAPVTETWSQQELEQAVAVLDEVYVEKGPVDPQAAISMPKRLEAALDAKRSKWQTGLLRALFDALLERSPLRKLSVEHEWRWYNLAGFCLRPGWGHPMDAFKVEQLWKAIHQGVLADKQESVWREYWIMSRRVAGGLDKSRQEAIAKRVLPFVWAGDKGRKAARRVGASELVEIWRALASLELVDIELKVELGELLLRQLKKRPTPLYAFWALTRLGARVPIHGPANVVTPRQTAERWVEKLLGQKVENDHLRNDWLFALSQIGRCSGDRARDLDDALRAKVAGFLRQHHAPHHWVRMVEEVTSLESSEESRLLGDAPPPGLTL